MHDFHDFFHHVPQNIDQGTYRIFDPQCKAEILHWFSREDIAKEQKEEFIKVLLDFDDSCGDFYRYRAYLLASEALDSFKDCSLGDAIVEQLLRWSYLYFGWQTFPIPLQKAAREALQVTDKERVITTFVELIRTTKSWHTLRHAALTLGRLDPGNKIAIAALVRLLQVTKDEKTLWQICQSLGEIGCGNEIAIAALVYLMETTLDKDLCCDAIAALSQVGYGNQMAIAALVKFLQINRGDRICFHAAKALWHIDSGNAAATSALVYILQTTQQSDILSQAATYLLQIDSGNTAAIAALSERLENAKNDYFQYQFALKLAKFAPNNQTAINTLVRIVETSGDLRLVYPAAEYLLQLNSSNQEVITSVIHNLETERDEYFRSIIHYGFEDYYPNTEAGIDLLISIMEKTLNKDVCSSAISAFARIRFNDDVDLGTHQKVISTLVKFLQTNRGDNICFEAAKALWEIDPGNEEAIATLVEILEINRSEWIRQQAAKILMQTDDYYEKALDILVNLDWLEDSPDFNHLLVASLKIAHKNKVAKAFLDKVIAAKIKFIQTFEEEEEDKKSINPCQSFSYESYLLLVADNLQRILEDEHLPQVVTALKGFLSQEFYNRSSYRYEAVYNLIWYCPQRMTYPEFYGAWHS